MKNANRTMRLYIFSSLFFDFFLRYKSKIVVLIVRNFSVYVYFFFLYYRFNYPSFPISVLIFFYEYYFKNIDRFRKHYRIIIRII